MEQKWGILGEGWDTLWAGLWSLWEGLVTGRVGQGIPSRLQTSGWG